ncbi:expressed protein [Phakopsora pachyrhizi]|uniref:Expressed protein n=1 Tax=Phakopsora pachyrhizi TaxID=170000 RepID=A0AAV0BS29_PHAPC|nr:expressed protein [Phakopsora pachyrhizi]
MKQDYEDLKNCIQETKKQTLLERHIQDLKKIETILAQMIIPIRVKIYEKSSPENFEPYIDGLNKDLSSIVIERINDECYETLSEILNNQENILKPGRLISDMPIIPLVFKIFNYIEKFEFQSNRLKINKSSIKTFFSEEKPLKQLIWYISTVLIKKCGFIGVFLTSDFKEYIRDHNDLYHIKFLLNSGLRYSSLEED